MLHVTAAFIGSVIVDAVTLPVAQPVPLPMRGDSRTRSGGQASRPVLPTGRQLDVLSGRPNPAFRDAIPL
jgi:hypothetical protein